MDKPIHLNKNKHSDSQLIKSNSEKVISSEGLRAIRVIRSCHQDIVSI